MGTGKKQHVAYLRSSSVANFRGFLGQQSQIYMPGSIEFEDVKEKVGSLGRVLMFCCVCCAFGESGRCKLRLAIDGLGLASEDFEPGYRPAAASPGSMTGESAQFGDIRPEARLVTLLAMDGP